MKSQRPRLSVKGDPVSVADNEPRESSRVKPFAQSSRTHWDPSRSGILSFNRVTLWVGIASAVLVALIWLNVPTPVRQLEQGTATGRGSGQPADSTPNDQVPSEVSVSDEPTDSTITQEKLVEAEGTADVTEGIESGGDVASAQTQFSDVASESRRRFLGEARGGNHSVSVTLNLDPSASESARLSLGEQIDSAMPVLGPYLELQAPVTIIALEETRWGIETVQATFGISDPFSQDVIESIRADGLGRSSGECTGIEGFAQTDFENSVVIIDVGASCNWKTGPFIDDSESIVAHELTHILQYSLTGRCAGIPAWFAEGQAQFVGWNLSVASGQSLYEDARSFWIKDAESSGPVELQDLNNPTTGGAEYWIGALAVELLIADYGWSLTTDLLASLDRKTVGCGSPDPDYSKFYGAFTALTGLQPTEFNEHVDNYVAWVLAN